MLPSTVAWPFCKASMAWSSLGGEKTGKGMRGRHQSASPAIHVWYSPCQQPGPLPGPQPEPSAASSPPDVVDRGAEVMGPVGKCAVQAVFGAVAFGVRLVDADSSFVVAQVVPALSVPCGPVQEWTSGTWNGGRGSLSCGPCS